MTNTELAFQFAKEVTTQLITLSSALIAVSVTFIKDFEPRSEKWLRLSWLLYILSILLGVLALMTLTGTIQQLARDAKQFSDFEFSTQWTAGGQIIAFFLATTCLVIFGWQQRRMVRSGTARDDGRHSGGALPL